MPYDQLYQGKFLPLCIETYMPPWRCCLVSPIFYWGILKTMYG